MKLPRNFHSKNRLEKLFTPFPIAVFGTLRTIPKNQGNALRMLTKEPIDHKKCFIPHMTPEGIWLNFNKNSCGAAELFFYKKEDWLDVITSLDSLESFDPHSEYNHSYHRTLMKIHVLPDDFQDDFFNQGLKKKKRDLKIPKKEWKFESLAAWIYSNQEANLECNSLGKNNPILWC